MLIHQWAPVTSDFGLIQAPLGQFASAFMDWQASLGCPHRLERIETGLGPAFDALPPLSSGKQRRILIATRSGWTAQFQSGIQGSDPFPAMSLFAERLGVLAMRVCCTPPTAKYSAAIWEVYAPPHLGGRELNQRRSVCAANDGGRWVFEQSGEPYPFEDLASYSRPRERDRFNGKMLTAYLGEFGLFPFRDDFYVVEVGVPALLLERPRSQREPSGFTLEEVIAGKPWLRT